MVHKRHPHDPQGAPARRQVTGGAPRVDASTAEMGVPIKGDKGERAGGRRGQGI